MLCCRIALVLGCLQLEKWRDNAKKGIGKCNSERGTHDMTIGEKMEKKNAT
jgi:hypothetical protein